MTQDNQDNQDNLFTSVPMATPKFPYKAEARPDCPGGRHSRRPAGPHRFLSDPGLAGRLDRLLTGAPWDVFTTPEVARALRDDLNPLTLNDWQYQRTPLRPPREPLSAWKGNIGYYRKDRLIAWAATGGEPVHAVQVWQMSAEYAAQVLSFQQPESRAETAELIEWLLANGLIRLRASPVGRFRLFGGET